MKADLAIYSYVVGASRRCMSVSLILGFNLDLCSCDNLVSFVNPVTYSLVMYILKVNKLV